MLMESWILHWFVLFDLSWTTFPPCLNALQLYRVDSDSNLSVASQTFFLLGFNFLNLLVDQKSSRMRIKLVHPVSTEYATR